MGGRLCCRVRRCWANCCTGVGCPPELSRPLRQERLRLLQVSRIKALREPAIDRCQEVSGCGALALLLPHACQAHGGPQLPGLGLLLAGHGQRLLEAGFRLLPWGPWALPQEQLTPERGLQGSGDVRRRTPRAHRGPPRVCHALTAATRASRRPRVPSPARGRGPGARAAPR